MSNPPDILLPEPFDADMVGKVPPQLYVGLGGQGGRMVKRLYERMNSLKAWQDYNDKCTGFLVLDTDVGDLKEFSATGKIRTVLTKPDGLKERLERELSEGGNPFLTTWLPKDYKPRVSAQGAGQIRIESRVAFIMAASEIAAAIDRIVNEILHAENAYRDTTNKHVRVHVFTTLAGGTGSGCFLPLAYLLRERLAARAYEATMHGHLLSAQTVHGKVGKEVEARVNANAYAALKELEYLNRLGRGGKEAAVSFVYRLGARNENITTVNRAPFDWVNIYDRPASLSLLPDQMAKACSDAAYINIATPAQRANISQMDNISQYMEGTHAPLGSGVPESAGYTCYYGAIGAAALICPRQELLEYCTLRFTAHTLRQQLTLPGANVSQASAIEAISPDRSVQQLILESQWRARFEELAFDEYKRLDARVQQLERQKVPPKDAKEAAQAEMFYARRYHAVNGRWPTLSGPAALPTALAFAGEAPSGGNTDEPSLVARVQDRIKADLELLDTRIAYEPQFNVQGLMSGRLTIEVNDIRAAADRKWRELQGYKEFLLRKVGDLLSDLRRSSDQNTPFDAIAERYLVGLLLKDHIDGWLNKARAEVDGLSKGTLVGSSAVPAVIADLAEKIKDRAPDSVREYLAELLPSVDYQADMFVFVTEANEAVTGIVAATNNWAKSSMRVVQLEAFKAELLSRANTFAALTRRALDRADVLDAQAAERRLADLEDDKNYQLRVEVLAGPGGPSERLWQEFWEDFGADEAAKLMTNAKWVGEVTTGVLEEEERRIASDPSGVAQADPTRILDELERKLTKPARDAMIEFVREQTELDDLLQLDAAYMSVDPNSAATRKAQVRNMREAANEPKHADHSDVVKRLSANVAGKLNQLKGRASLLAHINVNATNKPIQQARYLVAHKKMKETLENRYPSAVGEIDEGKVNAANALTEWNDPRSMMLVEVYAAAPIYAFPNVLDLHGSYVQTQLKKGSNNPLHLQSNWEHPEGLFDLQQSSRARQSGLLARKDTLADIARDRKWLVSLALGGILRLRGESGAHHAVFEVDGGDLPSERDGFGPLTIGSERELVAFFGGLGLLLGNEGYRKLLQQRLGGAKRKPGLAGRLVKWLSEAHHVGVHQAWAAAGELSELHALCVAIQSALKE